MCNNRIPWCVITNSAYGFAAAYIFVSLSTRSSSDIETNLYIVESTRVRLVLCLLLIDFYIRANRWQRNDCSVTNTGGDLGNNHFDLQKPGGGVELLDGCSSQNSRVWSNPTGVPNMVVLVNDRIVINYQQLSVMDAIDGSIG